MSGIRTGVAVDFGLGVLSGVSTLWFWEGPRGVAWSCGILSLGFFLRAWGGYRTLGEVQK